MLTLLHDLKSQNLLSELNYQFAAMIARKQENYSYTPAQQNLAILLSAMVSHSVMQGHTALRLSDELLHTFVESVRGKSEWDVEAAILQKIEHIRPLAWQETLRGHIAFSEDPAQVAPMLFQNGLLYFYRYWQAEHRIATYLLQAVKNDEKFANSALDKKVLEQLFPAPNTEMIDWQKVAVATALKKRFTLISGGPGTGKTYTVSAILLALQLKQLVQGLPLLNIALAAPTGKAAARMNESIRSGLNVFSSIPNTLKESLPASAQTIHRLIGVRPMSDTPLYNKENPLHLDVLVIDEASMIDVSLMEKLINALKPSTRLIMLGDKDQLASVEAGAIMGELRYFIGKGYSAAHCDYLKDVTGYTVECDTQAAEIQDSLCLLTLSRRFDASSGIGNLAAKVNAMQAQEAWNALSKAEFSDLALMRYPEMSADKQAWIQQCADLVIKEAVNCYAEYLALVKARIADPNKDNINAIFDAFEAVRFLTALRVSELGAERLNVRIAEALKKKGWLDFGHPREQYIGKPILITENDAVNQIFSGDIGIVLPDERGALKAYFRISTDNIRSISLNRLPKAEPAYVMTVHKSQGSEFLHTLFVMPTQSAPVLTKELVYTAVTRAKEKLTIFGDRETWKKAVKSEVMRQSGLREQIESAI